MGLQMIPSISQFYHNETQYKIDCETINSFTKTIVYNFKSKGYGDFYMYDGEIVKEDAVPNVNITYNELPNNLELNNYNYYERKIDLSYVKLQGSSISYELQ